MRGSTLTTLADLCESVRYGYTASASLDPCGPRFVRITDIVPDSLDWESVPYCEIDDADRERFALAVGDIVVARTGATVGYAKLIREPADAVFASYLVRFRVDPAKAEPAFVGRLVESHVYKSFVQSRIGGAAQPNASAPVLGSFEFPLPSRRSQTRIADILSAYDDLIENNRRRMALLEEAARQIYREWFVRLRFPGHEHTRLTNGVPEGWERIYLGDSVETQYGFTETATDEPVGPKFLRGTDINKTPFIDWSTVPYCPIDEILQRKYQLRVGDIVIIRMADPGKVAIVERDIDAVFASYLIRLRPTDPTLTPYYLFYVLSDDGYQGFISGVSTGSTRKTASAPLLVDFHLILPPQALLRAFEDSVRPLRQQITTLLIQNEKLRPARDLLLPRLMSGEITV